MKSLNRRDGYVIVSAAWVTFSLFGMLPYYIGGVIAEREKLLVQTPESFGKRFRIDVRVQNEVIAIHPKNKTVTIRNVEGKEYDESYDKLLLSPGANPVKPPLEGINSEGIFTLRNVEDTDHIKAYISDKQVKRAVVVGAVSSDWKWRRTCIMPVFMCL